MNVLEAKPRAPEVEVNEGYVKKEEEKSYQKVVGRCNVDVWTRSIRNVLYCDQRGSPR